MSIVALFMTHGACWFTGWTSRLGHLVTAMLARCPKKKNSTNSWFMDVILKENVIIPVIISLYHNIISYYIILYHIILYHISSYILSYHLLSSYIISYHFISSYIYHMVGNLVTPTGSGNSNISIPAFPLRKSTVFCDLSPYKFSWTEGFLPLFSWLVGGFNSHGGIPEWLVECWLILENPSGWWFQPTPLKNMSQIGSSSQLLGKIKFMFQTTNQMVILMLEMVTNKLNKTHIFPVFGDHVHYRLLR